MLVPKMHEEARHGSSREEQVRRKLQSVRPVFAEPVENHHREDCGQTRDSETASIQVQAHVPLPFPMTTPIVRLYAAARHNPQTLSEIAVNLASDRIDYASG